MQPLSTVAPSHITATPHQPVLLWANRRRAHRDQVPRLLQVAICDPALSDNDRDEVGDPALEDDGSDADDGDIDAAYEDPPIGADPATIPTLS